MSVTAGQAKPHTTNALTCATTFTTLQRDVEHTCTHTQWAGREVSRQSYLEADASSRKRGGRVVASSCTPVCHRSSGQVSWPPSHAIVETCGGLSAQLRRVRARVWALLMLTVWVSAWWTPLVVDERWRRRPLAPSRSAAHRHNGPRAQRFGLERTRCHTSGTGHPAN